MPQFAYVVHSNPVPGREDEYNDWYSNRHLADVVAVPGFVSAQRFRLTDVVADNLPSQRYMAIYTMDTDEPEKVLEHLTSLVETGTMHMSEANTVFTRRTPNKKQPKPTPMFKKPYSHSQARSWPLVPENWAKGSTMSAAMRPPA